MKAKVVPSHYDPKATYTFEGALERIFICESIEELELFGKVLMEEKKMYALFYLKLLVYAYELQRDKLLKNK
jgi:hypothetical protein